ncbi:MAG: MFS transporter [Bacteroidales bacterium]|nr:MFS transporter [Bacteroidales bacterium]
MFAKTTKRNPWAWVPTLYFAEGVPYVIVMTISVLMYKRLGLSNTEAAFYTSWLYLPWVIKPFWSPIVDVFRSKRWWIVITQFIVGAGLAGIAFTLPMSSFLQWTLIFFYLMAFSSATHDISADGFYMLALDEHEQSLFVGIRSTFYRIANVAGQGLLVYIAGILEVYTREPAKAWSWIFYLAAALFLCICFYHYIVLPHPTEDAEHAPERFSFNEVFRTFITFFKKPQALIAITFLLLFRLPEALITKICPLFLVDKVSQGGLGLTTMEIGIAQGTIGVIGLLLGGILGGVAVAKGGFRKWLWPMVMAITLPDCVYLFLAYYQPENILWVDFAIGIEQFGYGFGFSAYMLFMLYFSQGESKTAHYAFCTGFMALSMMLPGMVAGKLESMMGYFNFFILVMCLIPFTFLAAAIIKVPADFGIKKEEQALE